MKKVVNSGCLQKPKRQTPTRNPLYFPHLIIKAAKKDMNKENSGWESAAKLRRFMAEEEKSINNKLKLIVA